jgi:hypothetical protein
VISNSNSTCLPFTCFASNMFTTFSSILIWGGPIFS